MESIQAAEPISKIYIPEGMLLGPFDFLNLVIENKDILQADNKIFEYCFGDGFVHETERNNGHNPKKKVAYIGKLPFKDAHLRELYSEASYLDLIRNNFCDKCLGERYLEFESKRVTKKYLPMAVDSKKYLPAVISSQSRI